MDYGRAGLASPGHPPALSQPNLRWILLAAPRAWGDALLCDPTALTELADARRFQVTGEM